MKNIIMLSITVMLALGPSRLSAQDKIATTQQADDCSVNVSGTKNTVSLTCNKSAEKMVRQLAAILNWTRSDSAKMKELSDKLDEMKQQLLVSDKVTIEVAPNGIANVSPNFGDQTVNNVGPKQYPPLGVIPNIKMCMEPGKKETEGYSTTVTLSTDVRITRPAFMFYFDKPVADTVSVQVQGFNESRSGRDTHSAQPQNTVGFYTITVGSMTETSWYPQDKIGVSIKSQEPLQLLRAIGASGDLNDVNRVNDLAESITMGCS